MFIDELATNYTTSIYSRSSGKWIIREDGFVSNVIKRKEIVKNEIAKKRMRTKEMLVAEKADYEKWNKKKHITKTVATVTGYSLFLMLLSSNTVFAQEVNGTLSGGMNLIKLLQKATFWFGMGVAIWGAIEMALGSPGWKGRVAKGFGAYIAAMLIPYIFFEIERSLQNDVWGFIEGGGN